MDCWSNIRIAGPTTIVLRYGEIVINIFRVRLGGNCLVVVGG